ncbi:hypothetical protein BTO09_07465 [Gilvibacter sp. SZ-19]|uniref:DUF4221 family protein n=1 Tax=Gilvibacter sp. SZ-19 TaxID=754429 RepID=UPI000B3C9280|nr:DUF4221 family protein [Gilvibacter sp. SZ-19]ARV12198.1 hypothetical protein BTO09_07465 [Gilvibacter sp. SZ-19]
MQTKILIILGVFLIALFGCNSKSESTKKPIDGEPIANISSVVRDTLSIKLKPELSQYYNTTAFDSKSSLYYGYNEVKHAIDIFNFESEAYVRSIQLEIEGPNSVQPFNEITVVNDTIFLIGYFYFTVMDADGNIKRKIPINSNSDKPYYLNHFLYPDKDNGLIYQRETGKFFIKNANMQVSKQKDVKGFFRSFKVLGEYDLKNDEAKILDIGFPEAYLEKDFGFNEIVFADSDNKNIYLVYSGLPELQVYNIASGETTNYELSTEGLEDVNMDYKKISDAGADMTDISNLLNAYIFNSNYGPIFVNNTIIARVYQGAVPESVPVYEANKHPKKSAVQLFDKGSLQLLKNIDLGFTITFSGIYLQGNTMYFQTLSENEDELQFIRLTWD